MFGCFNDLVFCDGGKVLNKQMAAKLKNKAEEVARRFSNPARQLNSNNETFEVGIIKPLSETVAVVFFNKNTGKKAVAVFYLVNYDGGSWFYFFPTDSHVLGFRKLEKVLQDVEELNFPHNFTEVKKE